MEKSLHNVSDLAAANRSAVEAIIGHTLRSDDVLYIATLSVEPEPTLADRNTAWNELESMIAEMNQYAAKSGISGEQIDALVDAECAAERYGRSE